jgi:hypothetical protein
MSILLRRAMKRQLGDLRHETTGKWVRAMLGDEAVASAAAFRPADPDLAGHLVLDFTAFDAWYEEDVRLVSHPRDPYHRVDVRRSSRHVRVELDGQVLA